MATVKEPAPSKSPFAVVGDVLKVDAGDRELSMSLRVPMPVLERLMSLDDDKRTSSEVYGDIVAAMPEQVADLHRSLDDDAVLQFAAAFKWSQAIGLRLGKLNTSGFSGVSTG